MILSKKKRSQIAGDPITQKLVQDGVLSLHSDEGIYQASRGRTKFPYSFWAGTKYILTFSLLLWWLPTLGQMIAGYIGGRKTGGPWKGVAAAIFPVTLIFGLGHLYDNGILTYQIQYVLSIPALLAGTVATTFPILAPFIDFIIEYLAAFVSTLEVTFAVGLNGYLVTIIFAYIGGVVGQQVKRELVIRTASPYLAMPAIGIGGPIRTVSGSMKRSTTWWGKHPEKLSEMQKIPVRAVSKKRTMKTRNRRKMVAKPEQKQQPKEEKSHSPPRRELGRKGYDKSTINKRLVERALSRYQKR